MPSTENDGAKPPLLKLPPRCQSRNLDCVPVERKGVFRRGSKDILADSFAADQTWVNSEPRKWRGTGAAPAAGVKRARIDTRAEIESAEGPAPGRVPESSNETATEGALAQGPNQDSAAENSISTVLPSEAFPEQLPISPDPFPFGTAVSGLDALVSAAVGTGLYHDSPASTLSIGASHGSPFFHGVNTISPQSSTGHSGSTTAEVQPLASVQEACLLRYFIEELSPWFDHCDPQSHFRQVVPLRAHSDLTLRNAIFAVSSRHLSRLPQFKTSRGIVYHDQLLADLTTSSAVEYMLKCIPGLLSFHTVRDAHVQESLMAAAIILRQYEEMEEEVEEAGIEADLGPSENGTSIGDADERKQRVNFLAITKTIIYSMIESPLTRSSLAVAAYWIAIRQEVYYALTRKRAPCVSFTPEDWANATVANMMIMHAGEVTKWCWGGRSAAEYERLKTHQQHLITDYSTHLLPILQKPPDRSKGDIFPTVWYTTDSQVTGAQHLELARMILIAENPRLREPSTPRATHRKAESLIRSIVLNLCGIAIDNVSRRMPALVNAVISIMLYGEYFTEQGERDALREVIDRTKSMHAWPLKRPYERLCRLWEEVDAVEI
ncbi:uncharacterized protein BDV14DRAFT_202314 [Aspergillus stella-maris]|uniref:uncharacterized protein n=1 Tax=Aspergillus stella-maris TaxID=1810926 RepID=UPI003CCC9F0D